MIRGAPERRLNAPQMPISVMETWHELQLIRIGESVGVHHVRSQPARGVLAGRSSVENHALLMVCVVSGPANSNVTGPIKALAHKHFVQRSYVFVCPFIGRVAKGSKAYPILDLMKFFC